MSTSTWGREGAVLQAMPANEWGTLFNVFDANGERMAEVKLETERRGLAGTFWRDNLGATRVVEASGEARLSGAQEAINAALIFRLIHAQPIARRASNEAARWNREPLPYPAEGRWADEDENQAGASVPQAPVAPVVAAAVSMPIAARPRGRCPKPEIRRFFAIAREHGLNPSDKEAARAAICRYFGIPEQSRSLLTSGQWIEAGTAIKKGWLAWGEQAAVAGGAR